MVRGRERAMAAGDFQERKDIAITMNHEKIGFSYVLSLLEVVRMRRAVRISARDLD